VDSLKRVLPLLVLLTACSSTPEAEPGPSVRERAARAVFDLEDGRRSEGWEEWLRSEARQLAVRAIGRTRDASLVDLLLSQPPSAEVFFALGQLGDPRALPYLSKHAPAPRALEALGKLGDPGATSLLKRALKHADPEVVGQAVLALVRLRGRRVKPPQPFSGEEGGALREALEAIHAGSRDEALRWRVTYALANLDLPGRLPSLSALLVSPGWRERYFAVRGLARLEGDPLLRAQLLALRLRDDNVHVAAAAAGGLTKLATRSEGPVLIEAAQRQGEAADHHVRHAAITALVALAGREAEHTPGVLALLDEACDQERSARILEAAWLGRAKLAPRAVLPQLTSMAKSARAAQRIRAARACAGLPSDAAWVLLRPLAGDADPHVAAPALEVLAGHKELAAGARAALAREALKRDRDVAETGTALSLLGQVGDAGDLELLAGNVTQEPQDAERASEALGALSQILERQRKQGSASPGLETRLKGLLLTTLRKHPSPAVRAAAKRHLHSTWPKEAIPTYEHPAEPLRSSVQLELGRDVLSDAPNPRAVLHTPRGAITLELLREDAPRHVANFLALTRKGIYEGTIFHRVIAGFVAQGLDPRGDGWGTGGVFLRDEVNAVPFLRGAVGMPNAGPDSGGCQVFLNHVPTPHLDGGYTVFARVVGGFDAMDALDVGDVVERVTLEPK
jgi:cyclophilin family peptidyl-prolyl cis-trans isomerase/HEAT repeat protein